MLISTPAFTLPSPPLEVQDKETVTEGETERHRGGRGGIQGVKWGQGEKERGRREKVGQEKGEGEGRGDRKGKGGS